MNRLGTITQTIQTTTPATPTTHAYAYQYDVANNITWQSNPDGTATYSYDPDNQLLTDSQTNENYIYDPNGNRVSSASSSHITVGTDNQITNDGTYTYTYDSEGNRISKTALDHSQTILYSYDYRNRLTGVVYESGSTVTESISYTYNTQNQVIGEADTGTTSNLNEQYVYDGSTLLAILNPSTGAVAQCFFNGPGAGGQTLVLAQETTGSNATDWLLTNNEGSVSDVVKSTGSTVTLAAHYGYDSFGNIKIYEPDMSVWTGGDVPRVGYDNYIFNASTKMSLTGDGLRFYDPVTGTFIQQDPSGFGGGQNNLEAYVGNNPTDATDPTGMDTVRNTSNFFGALGSQLVNAFLPTINAGSDIVSNVSNTLTWAGRDFGAPPGMIAVPDNDGSYSYA